MINIKQENFLCKGCKHIFNFQENLGSFYEDCTTEEKAECLKSHLCLDCRILKKEKEFRQKISPEEAKFYCSRCGEYTNDKTPTTTCTICGTSLVRTGGNAVVE